MLASDDVRIDLAARVVHRGDVTIRLTPIDYRLLAALSRERGRLPTQDQLLREVWRAAHAEDRQTLRAHVANLRRKLAAPHAGGAIRTYPGVGYLFENGPEFGVEERPTTVGQAGWAAEAAHARLLRSR